MSFLLLLSVCWSLSYWLGGRNLGTFPFLAWVIPYPIMPQTQHSPDHTHVCLSETSPRSSFLVTWKEHDSPLHPPCWSVFSEGKRTRIRQAAAVLRTGSVHSSSEMPCCKATQSHVFPCSLKHSVRPCPPDLRASALSYCTAVQKPVWLWIKWSQGWNDS